VTHINSDNSLSAQTELMGRWAGLVCGAPPTDPSTLAQGGGLPDLWISLLIGCCDSSDSWRHWSVRGFKRGAISMLFLWRRFARVWLEASTLISEMYCEKNQTYLECWICLGFRPKKFWSVFTCGEVLWQPVSNGQKCLIAYPVWWPSRPIVLRCWSVRKHQYKGVVLSPLTTVRLKFFILT